MASHTLPPGPIRFALLFLALFVVPGHSLQAGLLSRTRNTSIGPIERAGLSVALSVAVSGLSATLLNFTPWGAALSPLLVTLMITGTVGVALAQPRPRRQSDADDAPRASVGRGLPVRAGFIAASCALAATGAAVLALAPPAEERSQLPFTEFYATGTEGHLADYPRAVPVGDAIALNVTVTSHERSRATFIVIATVNGTVERSWRFALEPGGTWTQPVELPLDVDPGDHHVGLTLLKGGHRYRELAFPVEVMS